MTHMTTISFKAQQDLKKNLVLLAKDKGINTSACIKLLLTEAINKELNRVTENGLTVRQEFEILDSAANDPVEGPFETAEEFMKSIEDDSDSD